MEVLATDMRGQNTGLMLKLKDSELNPLPYKLSPFTLEFFVSLMVERDARLGLYYSVFIDAQANSLNENVILALAKAFGGKMLEVNGIWMFYWRSRRAVSFLRFRQEVKPYVRGNLNFRKKFRLVKVKDDN